MEPTQQSTDPGGQRAPQLWLVPAFEVGNYARVLGRQPDLVAVVVDPFARWGSLIAQVQTVPVDPACHFASPPGWLAIRNESDGECAGMLPLLLDAAIQQSRPT
jgi:hypothetical protein